MATATSIVYIGGTKLLPYHVLVEQRSDWHHRFEVTVSTEKAHVMGGASKAPESIIIENAIACAGEIAEITIERPGGTFNFKGYITDVQIDHTYAGNAFVIFKGYSPTYLLDGPKSVASFEEKNLAAIFNEVTADFPGNIPKEVKPNYSGSIPFVVRYKETQFEFLNRLANTYGEWFYYDGQKIVFGELPGKTTEVKLSLGSDSMLSFKYGINLRPSGFKQSAYRYEDNASVEKSVAGFEPGWLDAHSLVSHKASKDIFSEEGHEPVADFVKDSNHIKYLAETRKSGVLSDTMIFSGQSANPGITIGAEVEVSTQNGFLGKYRVIGVNHRLNSNQDYYNVFRAIPVSILAPPLNKRIRLPLAEPQAAEVVENNDPDKLGRVRVKFKWQDGRTPWIRVMTNYAGPGADNGVTGTYFVPEIGDEVFVEFEQGNPDRPYVTGSNYHGKTNPKFADPDNNLKGIKTRSGHELIFDDTNGSESITIKDKNGNSIRLDTAGSSITISAPQTITLSATDINISAGNSINMTAEPGGGGGGGTITVKAKEDIKVSSQTKDIALEAAKKNISLSGKENIRLESSSKDISLTAATQKVLLSSKQDIVLSAQKNINLKATSGKMDVATKETITKSSGKTRMIAASKVQISGGKVEINKG